MDSMITSLQNPKVKSVIALRERKERDEKLRFTIEGYRELLRASVSKVAIVQLFICPELFLGSNEMSLIDTIRAQGAEVIITTKVVFEKISYRDRPDGLIGIAKQMRLTLSDLELHLQNIKSPLLVVAEAIEKPGNLGTILRSADGAGANGVIICDRCTDIYNPNVVRASVGTLFTLPVVEATTKEVLPWLKSRGISIVAATPHAKKVYSDTDLTKPLAIAVGTEQIGLTKQWMEASDINVSIPMRGIADSLNVAMATTILLFETERQRNC